MAGEVDDGIDPLRLDAIAFVLLLAVLPLVSYGATQDIEALWMVGLVLLAVGAVIPLVTEFALRDDEAEDGAEGADESKSEEDESENEAENGEHEHVAQDDKSEPTGDS